MKKTMEECFWESYGIRFTELLGELDTWAGQRYWQRGGRIGQTITDIYNSTPAGLITLAAVFAGIGEAHLEAVVRYAVNRTGDGIKNLPKGLGNVKDKLESLIFPDYTDIDSMYLVEVPHRRK